MASDIDTRFHAVITQVGGAENGGATHSEKPLIVGTAALFATVDVYDSATLLGVVQANGQGAWSLQLSTPLLNGLHDLSAVQAASYENDGVVNYFAVTIDATDIHTADGDLAMPVAESGRNNAGPYFPHNHFKTHSARAASDDTNTGVDLRPVKDSAVATSEASHHDALMQVMHVSASIAGAKSFDMVTFRGDHLVLDVSTVIRESSPANPGAIAGFDLGGHHNALTLSVADVLNFAEHNLFLDDGKPQLVVNGKEGDSVDLTNTHAAGVLDGSWEHHGTADVGGVTYNVLEHSAVHAELLVQQAVRIELH